MRPRNRGLAFALLSLALGLGASCTAPQASDPRAFREGEVRSADGVPIHYRAGGQGARALVFVHGWLGDLGAWESCMRHFAPRYTVVALDLAGHGRSGAGRADWTVERFADDVEAVVRALDLRQVVLIGHSMSGAITVAAAARLADRVELLVPVDTLQDVEWDLPPEIWEQFFGGLRADFPGAVEVFFRKLLAAPSSPPAVIDALVARAGQADASRAVPMLERARAFDLKGTLARLRLPIHAINSDQTPTALETNRRYAQRFEVEVVPGCGHWPHLEAPAAFEAALEHVLADLE